MRIVIPPQPATYAGLINEFYQDYLKKGDGLPQQLEELRAKDFPERRLEVKVE